MASAFGEPFQNLIARFAADQKLMTSVEDLSSDRFIARSLIPHIEKLSQLFNRTEKSQDSGLDPYWKNSSNRAHLRLAYFLYFMPSNLFRTASIWAELSRLGFKWPSGRTLKGIELGAGPASGACGIAAGEKYSPTGIPNAGHWALIEQDRATLELGARWANDYFSDVGMSDWGTRTFHRKISFNEPLLPQNAPKFNLWLMSFMLNEFSDPAPVLASRLMDAWERHLEEEGIIILVEPALKLQSRRLLELRKALLVERETRGAFDFQVLLPCLGHQSCGALAAEEDWCHEEVMWWRPPYFRVIDRLAGLDRKTLPFSYLVLARSNRPREEILPALDKSRAESRYRLVSPSHREGNDQEFFICGQDGKRRARFRGKYKQSAMLPANPDDDARLQRGDLLLNADVRGDMNASRIEKIDRVT